MDILFLDANIFFTATYSSKGASRVLFELAKIGKIRLVTNRYALVEAEFNIRKKIGEEALVQFFQLVSVLSGVFESSVGSEVFVSYAGVINQKDLPILVGAFESHAHYLITLDRKDFMTEQLRNMNLPFGILLPGEYLQQRL